MNNAQSPEDIPKLFVENWNQRRPDLMAALFEEDADFINVVGLWWNNRNDILKAHRIKKQHPAAVPLYHASASLWWLRLY